MLPLVNCVRHYAWGSDRAIAELQGRPVPSPRPEAELWMGAHPLAPSTVESAAGRRSLIELIDDDPIEVLGEAVVARFGPRLPFLFKVLAASAPLSLQAHPDEKQARQGFLREQKTGLARDDERRNYPDRHHKPELITALTPFEALCGFRTPAEVVRLLGRLDSRELAPFTRRLDPAAGDSALRRMVEELLALDRQRRERLVADVVVAAHRLAAGAADADPGLRWALVLSERYPGDVGIVLSLLLQHVRLAPGDGLYLPAGVLHSYLGGVGVEIMAASDNVLRGGCTVKHVDADELLRVLDLGFRDVAPRRAVAEGAEAVYPTPADEFRLSAIELDGRAAVELESPGPEILLSVGGEVTASPVLTRSDSAPCRLSRGQSLFVTAAESRYRLAGHGRVYRAAVGLLHRAAS